MGLYRKGGSMARCFIITSLTSGGIFLNIHNTQLTRLNLCAVISRVNTHTHKNPTYTPTPINMYVLYFVFVCFTKNDKPLNE